MTQFLNVNHRCKVFRTPPPLLLPTSPCDGLLHFEESEDYIRQLVLDRMAGDAPLLGSISFMFMQFWNFWPNNKMAQLPLGLPSPVCEILDPPLNHVDMFTNFRSKVRKTDARICRHIENK